VEGLGRAHKAGLTKAVGVSNFKAVRVREANKILQVPPPPPNYHMRPSLLQFSPDGFLMFCGQSCAMLPLT